MMQTKFMFRLSIFFLALVQWFKGAREITNGHRTIKEVFNDYVRFSVKEAKESDSGIYFLVARNKHGVDRAFCQVTVSLLAPGENLINLYAQIYIPRIKLSRHLNHKFKPRYFAVKEIRKHISTQLLCPLICIFIHILLFSAHAR